MARTYETRAVLAGAYRMTGSRDNASAMLTHVALVVDGEDTGVLCSRVKLANLADQYALTPDARAAAATCSVCAARDPRQYTRGA